MEDRDMILRDVELRLRALEELRQIRTVAAGVLDQLQQAKAGAAQSENGSAPEQQYLREATEASARLAALRERQYAAERELRRTAYLLDLLSE